jgi:TonB family protein
MPRYSCPFTYLSVGTENGGILMNLSEIGLSFQAMSPVQVGQKIQLRIVLPGSKVPITPEGQVVWTDEPGEFAGARLLNVSSEDRTLLRSWLASEKVNQAPSQKPNALPNATKADSDSTFAPADSGNVEVPDDAGMVSADAGKQDDELGVLRSAFQFRTIESETRTWLSAAIARVRNLTHRQKLIGTTGFTGLAFLILLSEAYFYAGRGVFQSAERGIEASLQQFKKDAVEGGAVPAWVTRALSRTESSTEEPKPYLPDPRKKTAGSRTASKNHREAEIVPSRNNVALNSESVLDQATVPSAPPLALWLFRVQGNRQTLLVPANPTRPIPFQWELPATSLRLLGEAESAKTLSSELFGRAPELYEPPSYPSLALHTDAAGSVELLATIAKDGSVNGMNLVSGNSVLAAAVMDAVRHWKYKPYVENGIPVEGNVRIKVTFSMLPH